MEQQPIKRDAPQPVTIATTQPLTNAPKSNTDAVTPVAPKTVVTETPPSVSTGQKDNRTFQPIPAKPAVQPRAFVSELPRAEQRPARHDDAAKIPNDPNATTPGTQHGPTELQHGDREAGDVRRTDIEFGTGTPKVAAPVTTVTPVAAVVPPLVAKA